ncbi:cyclic pyranopterin monophosphate synthase subunit MoaC [Flavobacterium glycines]|uniref:Molybdopterin adenylyltransferase n=1 Tax=Flavobacterium glycines TaxID=551990 RepID=A0A1B9DT87_9FLAO|nr:bifunctional molybdenum cofactor biosynthesis protein MoaC/MoaB [Flavobacterium glycines]OCB72913.1 molybdenum cofactor biosynthesis protein MoaC [Flavobacterium glycines]GEL12168.1 bifunctional molybdenum cofactor biosynthesis protein MoaC/MoaB [Flavobacterium glycines]SDJ95993.1 cyclic pyranopterin monophosphate synthase subunit MoaC [Flavobacterium glycines]
MVDITHKISTLRSATAMATVKVSLPETIEAIEKNLVPKGNVLEMAKTAGLFAVKNTHLSIPDCHPLPIEYTAVAYEIKDLTIDILFTVKTVYKTGVEVEAMHGASIVALTMYDMLKPIDKNIEISTIKLVEKKGGKSSYKNRFRDVLKAAVFVCSDSIFAGEKEDRSGKVIVEKLESYGVETTHYEIIPDEVDFIQDRTKKYAEDNQLVIFTGGTGLSPRDVTPEALEPLLENRIPGIEEAIRNYGQDRMPYAMLSRSVVGTIGDSLVLALPGSVNGAKESMDAVFPHVLHVFHILKGSNHDTK